MRTEGTPILSGSVVRPRVTPDAAYPVRAGGPSGQRLSFRYENSSGGVSWVNPDGTYWVLYDGFTR